MKVVRSNLVVAAAAVSVLLAGVAVAGGGYAPGAYGKGHGKGYGQGMGYGPGAGYGPRSAYGMPPMGFPPRPERPQPPQRPTPPERPTMGGMAGYSSGMPSPAMRGYYPAPQGYGAPQPAAPAKPAAPAEAVEAADVSISQMRFSTQTVTIKAGGTVTWTNGEGMPHTVTADDGSFGSAQLGAGDTFSFTFNEPGSYSYFCALHPSMRATVVVVA